MARAVRRFLCAAVIAGMATPAIAACSSQTGSDMRDCGYSVTWRGHVYLSLIYVRHPQKFEEPEPGPALGHGFVPQCPGDSDGTSAKVYAVQGVPSDVAVMAKRADGIDKRPVLCIRKGRALPQQLLGSS